MSDVPNPLFLVSGRVYTNDGDLLDKRMTIIIGDSPHYKSFNDVCKHVVEQEGYVSTHIEDEIWVKILVDLIEEVVD